MKFEPEYSTLHGIVYYLHHTLYTNRSYFYQSFSSSEYNSFHLTRFSIDPDELANYWASNDQANSWYMFFLSQNFVNITHYGMRSTIYGPGNCHPKNWIFEGSRDGISWSLLDQQVDTSVLDNAVQTAIFSVNPGIYKNFRLTMNGINSCPTVVPHSFQFNKIDIFGELYFGLVQDDSLCSRSIEYHCHSYFSYSNPPFSQIFVFFNLIFSFSEYLV